MTSRRKFLASTLALALSTTILSGWRGGFVGYDIILQIGDSNSYAGLNSDGSTCYDPAIDTTNSNCFEYRSANRNPSGPGIPFFFEIVADSFHPFDYAPPGQGVAATAAPGVGPGANFVKAWQTTFAAPGRKTMIVTLGVGGTGLCNTANSTTSPTAWQATPSVGQDLAFAVQKVNLILAQSSLNKLVAVLWTCGANDGIFELANAPSGWQATYQTAFQALDSYLRGGAIVGSGATTFVWLIQPLVPIWAAANAPQTNAALANLPNVVSKCGYADPTGPGMSGNISGQVNPAYHLTGGSNRLIGSTGFVNAYNNRSA